MAATKISKILSRITLGILIPALSIGVLFAGGESKVFAVACKDKTNCGTTEQLGTKCAKTTDTQCLKSNTFIKEDLQPVINVASALIGIVIVGVIMVGGIQYSTASGNSQAVSAARTRILNGLIALLMFIFMWAFLSWLVPGGVFG